MSSLPRPRHTAIAALVFALLAVLWAQPSSFHPAQAVPTLGDPLHLGWVMAWDAHQLLRAPWALFESNTFYPYPNSLAFGDHLLPQALIVAPLSWLTGNAVLASNAALVLALALSGTAMFFAVARATGSLPAAFLAGAIYAFNGFTRANLSRVQVLSLEWWPLALVFLVAFVRGGRARHAALAVAFLALQALSGAYYLVFTALIAPAWLVALYLLERRFPAAVEWRRLAVPSVAAALVGIAVLWPYVPHRRVFAFDKPLVQGTDAACHVIPAPATLWRDPVPDDALCRERGSFLGASALGLALLGLLGLRRRGPEARALGVLGAVSAAFGLVLCWGPTIRVAGQALAPGPFGLLYDLASPVRSMDGPQRSIAVAYLGLALFAGLGAARLFDAQRPRLQWAAAIVLALLQPVEHWSRPNPEGVVPTGASVPPVYRWLAAEKDAGPVVDLPLHDERAKRLWSVYQYFSTYHWRPIPIGRASFYPPLHDPLVWALRGFPDPTSLLALDRLGIRTLVVHPFAFDDGERDAAIAALDASPQLELVREFDNEPDPRFAPLRLGRERVYRLKPDSVPAYRPPCEPEAEIPREGWQLEGGSAAARRKAPAFLERARRRHLETTWDESLAVDGDLETGFRTEQPQRAGDFLQVKLPAPVEVAAVVLERFYPFDEFPRNLTLTAWDGDGNSHEIDVRPGPEETWFELQDLLERPRGARQVLRLPPLAVKRLRLRLESPSDLAWPPWSVAEVRLYGRCVAK